MHVVSWLKLCRHGILGENKRASLQVFNSTTGWRFGLAVTRWSRSFVVALSQALLVPAWMSDCLWTGKPPRCRTRHPGLLRLSQPSAVGSMSTHRASVSRASVSKWVPSRLVYHAICLLLPSAGVINRHIAWHTCPYPWSDHGYGGLAVWAGVWLKN